VYGEGLVSMQLRAIIDDAASCATVNHNSESIRLPSILDECDLRELMLLGSGEGGDGCICNHTNDGGAFSDGLVCC
jgi:hypothetical protein